MSTRELSGLPEITENATLGARIEQIKSVIHEKRDTEGGLKLLRQLLPEDLIAQPTGELGRRIMSGRRYGADSSALPIPPAITLEAYDPTELVLIETKDLKTVPRNSEPANTQRSSDAGRRMEWTFPVAKDGEFQLRASLKAGPSSSIVGISVDGSRFADAIDLYDDEDTVLRSVNLGRVQLRPGKATLRMESVGMNPKSKGPHGEFGIDLLTLRRVDVP